ncbi:MAG: hypothetical protein DMD36_18435 [Gemmatimonadetes bacterium]|nr:MAG: hypothetical protein DMD36_18435 [Gemmatimonadota bacterium]
MGGRDHGPPVLPLAATEHGVLQLAHVDRNLHERVRFYMDARHDNPALGPAPEPADRVGVAPEHPRRRGAVA